MDLKIVGKIMRDVIRVDRVQYVRSEILTVAHDNDRSFLYRGKHYSPLIDTIEDDLRERGVAQCQSIARIISTIKGERSYGNVASPEGGFARALLHKRALGLSKRNGEYPFCSWEEDVWGYILDRTGARKVVAILPSRELCAAVHKRGLWVADVQHGVIADAHSWYGAAFRSSDPPEWVPDAFLCWDEPSADIINTWAAAKNAHATVIGNRWLVRFAKKAYGDRLVQEIADTYQPKIDALGDKPKILVSMSWGASNIPNGFLVDALAQVIKDTADSYTWLLRLHPNQLIGFATDEGARFAHYHATELGGAAVWDWVSSAPLPFLLGAIDMHISWHSSVAIEAAQCGIKSALLDPDVRTLESKSDYFNAYRAGGRIDMIPDDAASIRAWLQANRHSKTAPQSFDQPDANYTQLLDFLIR